jgi:hypothetical protein
LAQAFAQVDPDSYKWEGWICCKAELVARGVSNRRSST